MESSLSNFSSALGPSATADAMLQSSYTDLNQLQKLRNLGHKDESAALKELSKQFESIFMQMMLKSMRKANAPFEQGSMFQSNETQFYRDMMDNELTLHLSQGKGIGLADVFYQQMLRQFNVEENTKAAADAGAKSLEISFKTKPPALTDSAPVQQSKPFDFENQDDFIREIYPHAQKAAQKLNLDPAVLLAQSALETGWGKHLLQDSGGSCSHNLFNIKADDRWQGDKVTVNTLEYQNGVMQPERAAFRSYQNFADSMEDYVELVRGSERYQAALESSEDPEAYIKALHQAGYATDPDYADKVIRVLNSMQLAVDSAQ